MSITATYVSSTSFTVATDKTSDFCPGRALRMDCGADGIKYGYVSHSSYSSPNTTVTLESTESQAITGNLVTVDFSRVASKETGGNLPLQVIWMNRGFKSGLTLSWKDADEIYIDSGALHIDNGTAENIYCAQAQISKQLTSLSASTWYAIYVDPPSSGLSLVADDIEYSSTMPTYDQAKRGWYHPSTTDLRCIGFIYSSAASAVREFWTSGNNCIMMEGGFLNDHDNAQPSNTWTDQSLNVPLIGNPVAIVRFACAYVNSEQYAYWRRNGGSSNGTVICWLPSGAAEETVTMDVLCDSAGIIETKWGSSTTNYLTIHTIGFRLPVGM